MHQAYFPAAAVLILALGPTAMAQETAPKTLPFAPSLPALSKEETKQIDDVINRFILYDSGELPGADGKQILADFDALGPEAIPRLLWGLNRAAHLQESCPVVIISRKLKKLLAASRDGKLLDFVRETAGASGGARRHLGTIQDLKLACMVRKSYLQRNGLLDVAPGQKLPGQMSTTELARAALGAKGVRLQQLLIELEKRDGDMAINALGTALLNPEPQAKALAKNLLVKHLTRQEADQVKKQLNNHMGGVRAKAALVAGQRDVSCVPELIDLLNDSSAEVHQAARQALVRLSRGQDFGPSVTCGDSERAEAVRRWQAWWVEQKKQH